MPSVIATAGNNGNGAYDGLITTSYAYNSAGLLTLMTDRRGTDTAYAYATVNSKPA